jgi:hypothetical protein
MAKINYTDKIDSEIRNVPNINKVTAADMNEIKASVNVNVDDIALAKTALQTSLVTTNLPISPVANLQAYAESNDAAVLIARSTGVSTTYTSTVSVGGTTFNQGAFSGEISSDEGYFRIVYAGATNITVTNLNAISTFVFIDKTGALGQQSTEPTREDRTRKIFVMRIGINTVSNQIIGFEYENNPIGHYANSIRDIYEFLLAQGVPFKKDQLVTGRSTDLGFDVSAGSLLEFGGTGDIYNPNIKNFNSVSNTSYNLLNRTTIVSSETNLVKFWDNNETITALGSTTLVGHRLFRFSNGNFAIQYGQGNYANMSLAKTNAPLEEYVLNPALKDATFFGWWFIESTATNTGGTTLTDFVEYTIGVSGGSSNSLSGALLKGNNLSDLLDVAAARTNLGVTALDAQNLKLTGAQELGAGVKTFTDVINGFRSSFSQSSSSLATVNSYNGFTNGIGVSGGAANGNAGYFANNSTTYPVLKLLGLSETDLIQGRGTDDTVTFYVTSSGALSATTLTPTALTTGNIPYKSAGALLDSPISTDGAGVTIAGSLRLEDNIPLFLGTGADLSIKHNGTNASLTNSTGNIIIQNVSDNITLLSATDISLAVNGSQIGVQITGGGGVNLRHNNVAKLETTATGATVTGDLGSTTLTPTALTTGTIPYKSANELVDSPISTNGTDVVFSGDVGVGTTNTFSKFQVNNGTNINLGIKVGQTNTSAVMINAYNDAVTANIPLEFRASSYSFTAGAATFASSVSAVGVLTAESLRTDTANTGFNLLSRNSIGTALYVNQAGTGDIAQFSYGSANAGSGTSVLLIEQGGIIVGGSANFASSVSATDYKVSALNTAPASATATGTTGEIRYTADYIYVCVATNTWKRSAVSTW